jgi:hypothetical protein
MFLLALFYDLQAPSDGGSCIYNQTEFDCMKRTSYLDDFQQLCKWAVSMDGSFACEYAHAEVTLKASLYIAIIVSCISSLINRPFAFLFDILNSPLIEEKEEIALDQKATNMVLNNAPFDSVLPVTTSAVPTHGRPPAKRKTVNVKDISNVLSTYHGKSTRHSLLQVVGSIKIAQSDVRDIPEEAVELHQVMQSAALSTIHNAYQLLHQKQLALTAMYQNQMKILLVDNRIPNTTQLELKDSITPSLLINPISLDYQSSPFTIFQNELLIQFQVLTEDLDERRAYLHKWGIEDGNIVENMKQWMLFSQEIRSIQEQSLLKLNKLKKLNTNHSQDYKKTLKLSSDTQVGHELLHLFVLDLLGRTTPAAIIYHGKMDAEYRYTRVVSKSTKVLVVLIILALNAFFAYYAVLKGYVKGITWQYNYLLACVMQMIAEVCFFETMETFWMHFLIPSFAVKEVQRAFHQVNTILQRLCFAEEERDAIESSRRKEVNQVENDEKYFFNCAEHLFLSTQIAKAFPTVMESMLILSYSTPFPGELAHKWKRTYDWSWKEFLLSWSLPLIYGSSDRQNASSSSNGRRISLLTMIIVFLQWFVAFPYELQRMMVRFVMPFVLSTLVMVWQMINNRVVGYSIAAIVFLLVICLLVYLRLQPVESTPRSIAPQHAKRSNEEEVEHEENILKESVVVDVSPVVVKDILESNKVRRLNNTVESGKCGKESYNMFAVVTERKVNEAERVQEDSDESTLSSDAYLISHASDSEFEEYSLPSTIVRPDQPVLYQMKVNESNQTHDNLSIDNSSSLQASDESDDDDDEDEDEEEIDSIDIKSFQSL